MKELSIEQKARRYDEVVNEIKNLRDMLLKEGVINKDGVICDNFNRIFPELKESEDEKIRKRIINALHGDVLDIEETAKAIAWLEKQKEPKYLDTSTCEPWSDEQTRRNLINFLKSLGVTEIPQASYNRYLSYLEKQGEQKPAWSEDDEYYRNIILYILNNECVGKTDKENAVNWLKSLKDRIQPKQEWSEEDKRILNSIIQTTENHCFINLQERNWLKSLRPQSQWKPSEEQMKAINHAIQVFAQSPYMNENDYLFNMFKGLKKDLEQLKAL